MSKKLLSILLVGLMIFSTLPTTFAQNTSVDEIYNEFSEYFVKETSFESITQSTGSSMYDNVGSVTTDLPFVARAYFKKVDGEGNTITPPKDTPVVFYVINHAMVNTYINNDIITLQMDMPDLGHEYPYGIDPVLKYDRYAAALDFFDYHLKGNIGTKAVYAYPKDDNQEISITDNIYVKFNAPIAENEITSNVKVLDAATGNEIEGSWSTKLSNTEWTFSTDKFVNAHVYNLIVPTTIKDSNGLNLSEGYFTKFVTKGGEKLYINGGETPIIADGNKKAYVKLPIHDASNSKKVEFTLDVAQGTNNLIYVYGVDGGVENKLAVSNNPASTIHGWSESHITWDNAPALSENEIDLSKVFGNAPIATIDVTDAKEYEIDVTTFVEENAGSDMTFVLVADKKVGKKVLDWNFDREMTFTEEHDYRKSGSPNFDSLRVTTSEHYGESGGALEIYDVKNATGRLKLLNIFQNAHFTSLDKGRKFHISGMLKPATTGIKYNTTDKTWTQYDSITTTVRMCIMSNYHGDGKYGTEPITGTQHNVTLTPGVWTPFSFAVEVNDNILNANGTVLALDQALAPDRIAATSIFIDNLVVVEETGDDLGTQVVIDNETNVPNVYIENPYIDELIDIDELSINLKDAISSGDFKEGDTIELRTTVKAFIWDSYKNALPLVKPVTITDLN